MRSWPWRTWYRQKTARVIVAIALVAMVAGTVLGTGAFIAHAFQHVTTTAHQKASPHTASPRQAGQWFQLSHFGKSHPATNARIQALQQARALPLSSIGTTVTAANSAQANTNISTLGSNWTPLGPQPINTGAPPNGYGVVSGRITAEAVNPTNANDIWVGAADGGLWHSPNGGASWFPATDNQPTLSIGAIAIDPHNPKTIYVGTGEGNFNGDAYWGAGILKSTDGGATWTQYGLNDFGGLGIAKIAVDPNNSSNILLAADFDGFTAPAGGSSNLAKSMGIWRSTNAGVSWSLVLTNPANTFGSSTTPLGVDVGTDVVFDPHNAGVVWVGVGNQFGANFSSMAGVWRSTNSGTTWLQIIGNVNIERVSLGISSDGTHVYVAMTDGGVTDGNTFGSLFNRSIYASPNGGSSWNLIDVSGVTGMASDDNENQWWYDSYVAVDPTNSTGNTVYVGGVDIWQTKNGGSTWTNITNAYNGGPVHPDQHALVFKPGSSSYYIGNDGGVWSGDSSGNFTDLNSGGLNITQFYGGSIGEVGSDAQLYGGAQDNGEDQYPGAVNNTSTVAQWNEVFGGDGFFTAVDYTNNANVYEEYAYGNINKSTDGGATWNPAGTGITLNEPTNFSAPLVMSQSNPNLLLTGSDHIYRTTNGASSWSSISPVFDGGSPVSAIAIAASNNNYIYAGDNLGDIFVTTNGGSSWSTDTHFFCLTSMVTSLAVDPTNPSVAYATCAGFASGSGQHVFKTTNAGATWSDISASLPNIPFESVAVSAANHNFVVAGSDVGIFASTNAGSSWSRLGTSLPNVAVDQIFFNHSGSLLLVATHGRGMWELALPHLAASPSDFYASAAPGANTSRTFSVQNTGQGPLNWSSSNLPSWVSSISPASGTIAAGGSTTITVNYNTASYTTPQTLTGSLTLTAPTADDPTVTVPMVVVLTPGQKTWYFAEGYTGSSFTTYLSMENPNSSTATVTVKYLINKGSPVIKTYTLPAKSRVTKSLNNEVGSSLSISMVITSNLPIVAERPEYFNNNAADGGTDVIGANSLATTFDFSYVNIATYYGTWLTILNQNTSTMSVTMTFYPAAGGTPLVRTATVPAQQRGSINVASLNIPATTTYSVAVQLSEPGLVERVLYLKDTTLNVGGGAAIIGAAQPLNTWYFGAAYSTGSPPGYLEDFVVSNQSASASTTGTITFYLTDGTQKTTNFSLTAGQQQIISTANVLGNNGIYSSATITTTGAPILAERVERFRFGSAPYPGFTDISGTATPGYLFDFAEGYTAGGDVENLTMSNPNATQTAQVTVTCYPTNGSAPKIFTYTLAPHSSSVIQLNSLMPNQSFSMEVISNVPIVAERQMTFHLGSTGGTDVIGFQPAGSTAP